MGGTERVEQISAVLLGPACDLGQLSEEELPLLQLTGVFVHLVLAHTRRPPNGFDAGAALMCLTVLTQLYTNSSPVLRPGRKSPLGREK